MKYWETHMRKVEPYIPGDQPSGDRLIKLNTNECPYPPAPGVKEALEHLDYERLRKYPDPDVSLLVETLAEYYKVQKDQVFVGVGSDDVIAMAFMTFFQGERPVLFPDISYSFYEVWAKLFQIPFETPKLDAEFRICKEDYFRENGGIIFPNPNAPTGLFMPLDQVEEIIRQNQDVIVIVDEAYIDFGGQSALSLIDRYDNLLVVQTFSKSRSLAGLRVGFAIGSPVLIGALNAVKNAYNSYTMNLPSQILGSEAVKDDRYFRETVGKVVATRERSKHRLGELGFTFPDSMTNFLFVTHERVQAEMLAEWLKQEKIYVRYFKKPRLDRYLRISIGTDEEMDTLILSLKRYLERVNTSFSQLEHYMNR